MLDIFKTLMTTLLDYIAFLYYGVLVSILSLIRDMKIKFMKKKTVYK